MIRMYITSVVASFAIAVLGFVHAYTPIVSASTHTVSHSQHTGDNGCKVVCQATMTKHKKQASYQQKRDADPVPYFAHFSSTKLVNIDNGLLSANHIWRHSSWIPPDIILLSGAYSTDL